MDYDEGYFTPEEHSQPTGIFIDDFYNETSPES